MRVSGTEGFSQHVRYTGAFQNGTHAASGDYTGTMGGWFDQYFGSAFLSQLIVRDRTMHDRNFYQVLLCIFNTLGNSFLNFLGFTQTMTNYSSFITDYHQCRETECTATLGCLYNTIDSNHFFFQFKITFAIVIIYECYLQITVPVIKIEVRLHGLRLLQPLHGRDTNIHPCRK